MKIRTSFVANSSSSSFCIIGTECDKAMSEILKHFTKDEIVHGNYNKDCGEFVGMNVVWDKDNNADEDETYFYYFGLPIESFGEDKTISEMRQMFQERLSRQLGVNVPSDDIHLLYGEVSEY